MMSGMGAPAAGLVESVLVTVAGGAAVTGEAPGELTVLELGALGAPVVCAPARVGRATEASIVTHSTARHSPATDGAATDSTRRARRRGGRIRRSCWVGNKATGQMDRVTRAALQRAGSLCRMGWG